MNQIITLDQPNGVERTIRTKIRNCRPLPPPEARDWMTANETAVALGCSVATVHRLRRGVIRGVELLPCSRSGGNRGRGGSRRDKSPCRNQGNFLRVVDDVEIDQQNRRPPNAWRQCMYTPLRDRERTGD